MHTYGNLEYVEDEISVGEASTGSYIHPYAFSIPGTCFDIEGLIVFLILLPNSSLSSFSIVSVGQWSVGWLID